MWLITTLGFFSIVEKPEDASASTLTIRSRVRSDLEGLRDRYLPGMTDIVSNAGTDYRFRARVPKAEFTSALAAIGKDIDYPNFKSAVWQRVGAARAKVYGEVWEVLSHLNGEDTEPKPGRVVNQPAARQSTMPNSYGGVLIDDKGRILLREPAGHFDGYVWTFAKGKREKGASPEQTALREVKEETGYEAEILAPIPGTFRGNTGSARFFLMRRVGTQQSFQETETAQVRWATAPEAEQLISQTKHPLGRDRDLAVLRAALSLTEHLGEK